MRILYITGREIGYQRNQVILRALSRFNTVKVLSARERPKSIFNYSLKILQQSFGELFSKAYDLIFVGFYGHLLMVPIGLLTRKPVLFDAFVSTYDTLIEDRGMWKKGSLVARAAWTLDRTSCKLADHILLDTHAHVEYFADAFQIPRRKLSALPVGCNEEIFYPRAKASSHEQTRVVYYSSYLPLHGVDAVVRAAEELRSKDIRIRLIGEGQTYSQARKLAKELKLGNIEFLPEMPIERIAEEISEADICLGGHFGSSAKAGRVVPGKVYQILAMERALIASNSPANLELLSHRESAHLCPAEDPQALAAAILELHYDRDYRQLLAEGGRRLYLEKCSEAFITASMQDIVAGMLST